VAERVSRLAIESRAAQAELKAKSL
jgi:hypothetical protein